MCGPFENNSSAEGARSVEGAEVDIRRAPELVPEEVARNSGYKMDQEAPLARVDELPGYDAIIIGVAAAEENADVIMW
mgnify:CR=1 FL=1